MIERQNDCVACETCFNCGRKDDYYFHVCDDCGSEEQLYIFEGKELCQDCLIEYFEEVDMDEFD